MKTILALLSAVLLASCAELVSTPSPGLRAEANPSSRKFFRSTLPSKLKIDWPPPISHAESAPVQEARLRQIEAGTRLKLEGKGYRVTGSRDGWASRESSAASAAIDWDTFPAYFTEGAWDHTVTITFYGESMSDHIGTVSATWKNLRSDSIDSILLPLTLEAANQVPPLSREATQR